MTRSFFFKAKLCAHRCHRGFTLLELAFVLLIAGFIIGAVWIAAGHTWDNYRASRSAQQVTKITQNIREYYMNAQKLSAVSGTDITAALDQLNLFPPEMRRNPSGGAGGAIDHSMNNSLAGGSFHVLSMNCPTGALTATCFRIRMEGLQSGQCMRLLESVPVNDADLGILKVGALSMAFSTTTVTSPVLASTAENWCNQAGANNEVDWDFKLHN